MGIAERTTELRFGFIPGNAQRVLLGWQEFAARLGKKIGVPVRAFPFADLKDASQAFQRGEVDLAFVGNATALEIVESGYGDVFAQLITEDGPGYHSLLIASKSTSLASLDDVLGNGRTLRFSDGTASSTSGHLIPLYYAFVRNGIVDPASLFGSYETGSHQQNLKKVAEGSIDIATANDSEMRIFRKADPEGASNLKVVWTSPEIPQSPLLWRKNLQADLRRKILAFVIASGREAGGASDAMSEILDKMDAKGFRKSGNYQLLRVADIEMFAARVRIDADKRLTPEQKDEAIKQLYKRAAKTEILLKLGGA